MKITVKARPYSRKARVEQTGNGLVVHLTEPATGGKANMQLSKLLSRFFGSPVRLIGGLNCRKKLIEVEDGRRKD